MYTEHRIYEKMREETIWDTDWFIIDRKGKVAIVSSAGGLIPDSISAQVNELDIVSTYFRSLPIMSRDIILTDYIKNYISPLNEMDKTNFLRDKYEMSCRGFYYYDKKVLGNFLDFSYMLNSKPLLPYKIEHVKEIAFTHLMVKSNIEDFDQLNELFVNEL